MFCAECNKDIHLHDIMFLYIQCNMSSIVQPFMLDKDDTEVTFATQEE